MNAFPLSISTPEGLPVKTVKATLLKLLEAGAEPVTTFPRDAVRIVDAMAILHSLKTTDGMTYKQLASLILDIIIHDVAADGRVDWVVDTYSNISIKNIEHGRRNTTMGNLETKIRSAEQKVDRQFNKSLFKTELSEFLLNEWARPDYIGQIQQRRLMVTAADKCFCLSANGEAMSKIEVGELKCTHDEADTRMFLHALHIANSGSQTIIIKSPDTDVAVLAISVDHRIPARIILRTGTKLRARYIDLTAIAESLGREVCAALPGYHAFSGCDTTSAFVGRGNAIGLKRLKTDQSFRDTMIQLGRDMDITADLIKAGESAICTLYGRKEHQLDINKVRLDMFGSHTTDPCKLPPCKNASEKHIQRANYQAGIWRRCLDPDPQVPSPHHHGWEVIDNDINIQWIDVSLAPQSVLNCISCKCRSKCDSNRCSCRKNQLPCTGVCGCHEGLCENGKDNPEAAQDDNESDDDSDEY